MKFTATEADNQIVSDYFNMLLRSAVEVDRPLNAKRCSYNHGWYACCRPPGKLNSTSRNWKSD
jgi:hypothetical protein